MPKYCGDEAKLEYEVEAPLVGDYAMITVKRFDRKSLTAYGFQEITSTKTEMKWPDQEDEDGKGYFGGRQVDFKGLNNKKYGDKFVKQNFTLTIQHEDQSEDSSNTEIIDELPTIGPVSQMVGIPMATEMWATQYVINPVTGLQQLVYQQTWSDPTGTAYQNDPSMNCGKFDIECKDGVLEITVKISLVSSKPGKNTDKAFKYLKKRVENFWNSEANGYNQWIYHRTGCKRGDKCACSVIRNSKGKYLSGGCCKVPIKVNIEKSSGGSGDNVVMLYYLDPLQKLQVLMHELGLDDGWGAKNLANAVNTVTLYYPENRANTYAHEVGHMMGFPDQYTTGVVAQGSVNAAGATGGGAWPIDDSSVMGSNQTSAKKIHTGAQWFNDWIDGNIDPMVLIDR